MDVQVNQVDEKVHPGKDDDYLYLKVLYHVLPLDYVTISKLQSKLEGEENQETVRKLLDKMACDGYVEAKSKPRLGKRVIRSELTDKKLLEVENVLEIKLSAMEISEPQNISTCDGLHSVGSDLTRTRERSVDAQQNGSTRIQEQLGNNTPIRRNRQERVVYQGAISEMVWMGEDSVTVVRVIIPFVVVPVRKSAPGKLACLVSEDVNLFETPVLVSASTHLQLNLL
ncbi:meiosis-specific protein ASY1-like [Papaver somniferum]|uniref:meiosis-specific protein ASY1-like n=1 Tax=Papaver somniferum TaxID=3469 RepID=UPI000E6F8696|nr:meiosis-specific protein ASY1-like [Papaver somniferum]